jgi:nicotinate-nucleotide adenylyltransferase
MTKSKSLRIGIFGGTFDPPHSAHIHLVQNAISEFQLDRVYIVPSKFPPGKEPVASYEKRLEWAAGIFGGNTNLIVSALEQSSQMTVFGKEIFNRISLLEPEAEIHWILGEDQLDKLAYWKDIDSYGFRISWLVTPRKSGLLSKRLLQSSCSYCWTKMSPMLEVASHTIRESLVQEGAKSPQIQWIPDMIRQDVLETYAKHNQSKGR